MRRGAPGGERGFALLIVLWTLGLLALIGAQITASGRTETRLAANLRGNAVVEAAADGAVHQAMMRLMQGVWRADAAPHVVRIGPAVVEVRMEDEAGKVNPNFASLPVMQALLRNIGLDPPRAASLGAAIIDWRTRSLNPLPGGAKTPQYRAAGLPYGPASRPFESLDEIGLVLGMTPQVLARLRPLLSVYNDNDVDRAAANPVADQALEESRLGRGPAAQASIDNGTITATVRAAASGPEGARFTRQAVVRVKSEAASGEPPFQILTWETPAG